MRVVIGNGRFPSEKFILIQHGSTFCGRDVATIRNEKVRRKTYISCALYLNAWIVLPPDAAAPLL